jgi:ADP-heptose:LPS heptosyltransferase
MLGRAHARTLLAGTGLIDSLIETELPWRDTDTVFNPRAYGWRELYRVIRILRAGDFDLVFQAKRHLREHFLLAGSAIPRRVGYVLEPRVAGVLTHETTPTAGTQKTDEWLRLLDPFGGARDIPEPRLHLAEAERDWAQAFLRERGIGSAEVILGVHPGASVPEKRWPLERFAEVVRLASVRTEFRTLAFLDPNGYGSALAAQPGIVTAQVGLRHLMALLDCCSVLLCNDSGPMHIAGALGVPTVAIFGKGIDQCFAPLGEGHHLVTASGGDHTLGDGLSHVAHVPVSAVSEALEAALRRARA